MAQPPSSFLTGSHRITRRAFWREPRSMDFRGGKTHVAQSPQRTPRPNFLSCDSSERPQMVSQHFHLSQTMKLNPRIRTFVPLHGGIRRSRANRVPRFPGQQLLGDSRKPSVGRTKISRLSSHPLSFSDVFSDWEPSRPRWSVGPEASWTPPSREAAPHQAARSARAVSLAKAFSPARTRASAVGLGEARATGVSPAVKGRQHGHSPGRPWFSPRGDYGARVRPRGAARGDAVRRDRTGHIRAGGHVLPLRLRRRSILRVRARATATTPSLVDSETHETRPSSPLRVAAPDPWASSAPSAAWASSDTPPL